MTNCPFCGKLTDPKLDNCVHCGGFLKKSTRKKDDKSSPESQTCPNCGALVREGDIICVACGTNLLTGQKVTEEKPIVKKEPRQIPWLMIGIAAGVLVLILLVVLVLALVKGPVDKAARLGAEGRLSEAADLLQVYVQEYPDDAKAQFTLGRIRWSSNDYVRAADAFEQAHRLEPANRDAGLFAVLSLHEGDLSQTKNRQLAILETMAREHPADSEVLFLLGLARALCGDVAGAVDSLDRLEGVANAPEGVNTARAATMALGEKKGEALSLLRNSAEQNPEDTDAAGLLGVVASAQGDLPTAEDQLQKALSGKVSFQKEALAQFGITLVAGHRYDEAQPFLAEAVGLAPPERAAQYFHGVCLQALGRGTEALREYDSLLEPSGPYAAQAAVRAAQIHTATDSRQRAVEALAKAGRDAELTEAAAETVRGRLSLLDNDESGAREHFRRAISADPAYAPARLELGLWYVQRQMVTEGLRELQQYLTMVNPDDPGARALEVRALTEQLEQTKASSPAAAVAPPARSEGERS